MAEPYKMVVVNMILVLILLLGTLIYKYVFPKKEVNLFWLLIVISVLPTVSIFRTGVYQSGDFNAHIYQTISFYHNLIEGNIVPRWGGELNATYGYPAFIFAYPLPSYITSIIHFAGFSFIDSMKLFLFATFISSGIAMYLFAKEYLNKFSAFVAAIFYLYAPYHLVDLHFRVDTGEILAFVFVPLNFLVCVKIFKRRSAFWFVAGGVCFAALILSHQAVSLSFAPILAIFAIFSWFENKKTAKNLLFYFSSILIGLALSAFYWIPVLFDKQFTLDGLFPKGVSFEPFLSFIFSSWRAGFLFQGPKGELSFIIGYTQWITLIIICIMLFRTKIKQQTKKRIFFFLAIFVATFVMMQNFSKPIWNLIPILNNFQFSYRLLAVTVFTTSILAGLLASIANKKLILVLCAITVLYTILNWGNRTMIPQITDQTLTYNLPGSTAAGEGASQSVPKWADKLNPWFTTQPLNHLELVSGSADIKQIFRTNTYHEYVVSAVTDARFIENTVYFPGWKLYGNNHEQKIDYLITGRGLISFGLKKGLYKVVIKFEETPVHILSDFISLLAAVFIIIILAREALTIRLKTPKL